jgi:hypothetical protein
MIPNTEIFEDDYDEDLDSDVEFSFEKEPSLTYAMNTDKNIFVGKVDDVEAIKQSVLKIINTERYEYEIYSWNYGIELQDLYGKDLPYVMSEVKQRIRDALLVDDRIESVDDFEIEKIKQGVLHITFTVTTTQEDNFTVESEVNI